MLAGDSEFGAIRIGVSTLFVRSEIIEALKRRRLHRGHRAGRLDDGRDAPGAVDAAADSRHSERADPSRPRRARRPARPARAGVRRSRQLVRGGQRAAVGRRATTPLPATSSSTEFESVMENLEDAVALFSPEGELMFSNAAMRALLPGLTRRRDRPSRRSRSPPTTRSASSSSARSPAASPPVRWPCRSARSRPIRKPPEHLLLCHAIDDAKGTFIGAMLVARNLGYLSQVHTTLNYSRKLAALGRLMAGVAHEVKNPLNAMTIHLELLKQKRRRRCASRSRFRPDRRAAPTDARPDQARQRHRRRDQAARPGRGRVPEVRAARRAEAAAGAPVVARQRSAVDDGARGRAARHRDQDRVSAERARDQRRPGHAAAGAAQPDDQRLPGDARRRHAEDHLPRGARGGGSRSTSRTPASAFRRRISAASSICTSRRRKKAAASACRWCSASSSCTTGRSRCSRPPVEAHGSGCCFNRHNADVHVEPWKGANGDVARHLYPGRAPGDCPDRRRLRDQPRADPRAAADPRRAPCAAARHRAAGHRRAAGRAAAG